MAGMTGPVRVLDAQEVEEVRRLRAQGLEGHELAERYGVHVRTIWRYLAERRDTPMEARIRVEVERWARLYSIDLRPQERDALVSMAARAHWPTELRRQGVA